MRLIRNLSAWPHVYFQEHVPAQTASGLCACLRPYPCFNRSWAINYLVRAGRLVLAPEGGAERPRHVSVS